MTEEDVEGDGANVGMKEKAHVVLVAAEQELCRWRLGTNEPGCRAKGNGRILEEENETREKFDTQNQIRHA